MVAGMGQDATSSLHASIPGRRSSGLRVGWEKWRASLSRPSRWWLVAAAVVTAALWLSHMPALLFHAQLYADDGGWYQGAYTLGPLASLPHPAAGYFVLFQRLIASVSLLLPLIAVPTFFNAVALAVQVVGICYLLSRRMASAMPSVTVRVSLALLVIALPNAYDTSGNLTSTQWHLGLLAFLVIFAGQARRMSGHLFDAAVILGGGLTGPYCILLEPIIVWLWRRNPGDRRLRYLLIGNSVVAVAQFLVIVDRLAGERLSSPLAAGFSPLVRMIGRQVTLGLVVGAHGLAAIAGSFVASNTVALTVLTAIPLAVCAWAAWRGPRMLRAFCYFAVAVFALALVAPSIAGFRWPSLGDPADVTNFHPGGLRYFLYPLLAFAISLGWLVVTSVIPWLTLVRQRRAEAGVTAHSAPSRRVWIGRVVGLAAAGVLAGSVLFGVRMDWTYPPYLEEHWGAQVQRFEAAPRGTVVVFPINPMGWTFSLVAR
jgi:hypothetical protein